VGNVDMTIDLNDRPSKKVDYDLDVLSSGLADCAEFWIPELFPKGKIDGDVLRLANISGTPPRKNGSCVVQLRGAEAGSYFDHTTGKGGKPLSTLKEALGLSGQALLERAAQMVEQYGGRLNGHTRPRARSPEDNLRHAENIVRRSVPAPGTLVDTYFKARGLSLPASPDLLFCDDLTDADQMSRPGMVAIVRHPDGTPTGGIHRTYLNDDGSGHLGGPKAKMELGPCRGGVVMLAPIGADGVLGIGEGIETTAAGMQMFGVPGWAAISDSGMKAFGRAIAEGRGPGGLKRLVVFADAGPAGEGAAAELRSNAALHGIEAEVKLPRGGDDFADDLAKGLMPVEETNSAPIEWQFESNSNPTPPVEIIPPLADVDQASIMDTAKALTKDFVPAEVTALLRRVAAARLEPIAEKRVLAEIKVRTKIDVRTLNGSLTLQKRTLRPQPEGPDNQPSDELSALIEEFNARYAVVNEAGKARIYEQMMAPVLERKVLIRITFEDFEKFYQNRLITVETPTGSITKSAAEWWLKDPRRRQYLAGVVFDPTGKAPSKCWNLWSGFSVEPAAGDWGLMRDHIHRVICRGDQAQTEYLLNWVARMFQQPNKPGEVAVVFRGRKGSGKGILCNLITRAWGQHGLHITNAKHLIGNFNGHLRDCVALFADEAFFAGDKQHEGVLKGLITEPTLPIEAKHQNVIQVINMLHIMMASNSDWVVPASHDERRYAVFDAADNRIGDRKYFADIVAQMENGGLAAMIWDLLHRDISRFEVRDIPNTDALIDQKKHSLDSLHKWWLAVLDRGFLWKSRHGASVFQQWAEFYTTELLSRSYLQWCEETRSRDWKSREQLGRMMTEIYVPHRFKESDPQPVYELDSIDVDPTEKKVGDWLNKHSVIRKDRPPGYKVGSLEEARVRFTQICEIVGEWGKEP
jgi:hypothetical protein